MTITVDWLDTSQRAVHMQYIGQWTWDEYLTAVEEVTALSRTVEHTVVHISDFTQSGGVPHHAIGRLREISDQIADRRDHTAFSIIVGADRVIVKLVQVFAHLYHELVYFDTLDEARAFLREHLSDTA